MNLVTGATGIIGSHVALKLLQEGKPVIACKQKGSNISKTENLFRYYTSDYKLFFQKIKWVELDLEDIFSIEDALDGIVNVYHCAGLVSFHSKDTKKLYQVNELGTRNLVNGCLHKKIKAFCHVSSIAAIHNPDFAGTLNEEVFWKTSGKESHYARSKYNGEREIWRAIEEGLNAVIVNPGVVISPGFWEQSSSTIFNTCFRGNKFYTNGSGAFISAMDVAACMFFLIENNIYRQRFILIENNYSFKEILSQIQKNFKLLPPNIEVKGLILKFGWLTDSVLSFLTGREQRLTKAMLHSSQNKQLYSNKKLLSHINFPLTPIQRQLEHICRLYLADKSSKGSSI